MLNKSNLLMLWMKVEIKNQLLWWKLTDSFKYFDLNWVKLDNYHTTWMKIVLFIKNHKIFCCILFAVKPICKVAKQISQAFTFGKKYKTCTMGRNPFWGSIIIPHLLSLCFSKIFLWSHNFYNSTVHSFLKQCSAVLSMIFSWFKTMYCC